MIGVISRVSELKEQMALRRDVVSSKHGSSIHTVAASSDTSGRGLQSSGRQTKAQLRGIQLSHQAIHDSASLLAETRAGWKGLASSTARRIAAGLIAWSQARNTGLPRRFRPKAALGIF